MSEIAQRRERRNQGENHGTLVRLTYHRNSDGTVDVLQSPAPFTLVATCPTERNFLQETYSRPAAIEFNNWMESDNHGDLEVLSRDAHIGWLEFTEKGIVHVIKDIPGGFAFDVIGGAKKPFETMMEAAVREFAEETVLIDFSKGKLLAPDVDLDIFTRLVYQHYLFAKSLNLRIPPKIVEIIEAAINNPLDNTQVIPFGIPQLNGSEHLVKGKFTSELVGVRDEMDGVLDVHGDGLDVLKTVIVPTELNNLRIVDCECLEKNRDERPRALNRNFTVLDSEVMRRYLMDLEVEVPILGRNKPKRQIVSSRTIGMKNLGLTVAKTLTRMN